MKRERDRTVIEQLQRQILDLQKSPHASHEQQSVLGLGSIEFSFPGRVFPRGAIHELISTTAEDAACTNGFTTVVLSKLMQQSGSCVWISTKRTIFPPALKLFGIEPERMLFVDVKTAKNALWAMEESLKCKALSAVVCETSELSFDESRRLQLAVEQSQVTGFVHRHKPKAMNAVACVSRWKITSALSSSVNEMPGLGFPKWNVELLKVRNGQTGNWQVQWSPQGLTFLSSEKPVTIYELQTG